MQQLLGCRRTSLVSNQTQGNKVLKLLSARLIDSGGLLVVVDDLGTTMRKSMEISGDSHVGFSAGW